MARRPTYSPGARVRVDDRPTDRHCRAPWYLRGRDGTVVELLGDYRDPALLAYHRPGLPRQFLYKVRFRQADLWPGYGGPAGDSLEADLTENWLLPGQARPAGDN